MLIWTSLRDCALLFLPGLTGFSGDTTLPSRHIVDHLGWRRPLGDKPSVFVCPLMLKHRFE